MKKHCHCGKTKLDIDADRLVVKCEECGWCYTYITIPKRFIEAVERIVEWINRNKNEEAREQ